MSQIQMTETKRILILTADAGFGHRSAARAIAAALQEMHPAGCIVEITNPMEDKRVPAILRDSGADYDRMVRELARLYKLGYEMTDAGLPSVMVHAVVTPMLFEVMRDLIRQHQPDAIITPYPLYQASLGAIFALRRRHIPLLTVVTDMAPVHRVWFHEAADLCLVATSAVRDQAVECGLSPGKVKVTGIPVNPRLAQGSEPAGVRTELGWRPDLTVVLAVGGKRVGHLMDVLHVLNHSGLPLQLAAVAGGDNEMYHQFQSTEWHVPVHIYNFVEDMPAMLHAADCIVCKAGGLIVTESLACGLPILLTDVIEGQETSNARYVIEGGAGELAHTPLEGLEIMCHWLAEGGELLAQRARNARRLGRPRAAYDAAELAWAAAMRGPRVGPERHVSDLIALLKQHGIAWDS
ncbi:MAG: glycosyltransferase [Chloroflexi bacterium]|nr:glycosyltransferase [Chloroflexota bacterium]